MPIYLKYKQILVSFRIKVGQDFLDIQYKLNGAPCLVVLAPMSELQVRIVVQKLGRL